MSDDLQKTLDAFAGTPAGPTGTAPYGVNEPMIHHWCDAVGDRNPAYLDEVRWTDTWGAPRSGGRTHIGIVVPGPGERRDERWVVHNIGSGPVWEDCLFDFEVVGHYRFPVIARGL